jgi:hypothetical protein
MKSYKRRRAKKAAVIQQGEVLFIESIELRLLFFCSNFYLILIILDLSDLLIINRINEQKKTSFQPYSTMMIEPREYQISS